MTEETWPTPPPPRSEEAIQNRRRRGRMNIAAVATGMRPLQPWPRGGPSFPTAAFLYKSTPPRVAFASKRETAPGSLTLELLFVLENRKVTKASVPWDSITKGDSYVPHICCEPRELVSQFKWIPSS